MESDTLFGLLGDPHTAHKPIEIYTCTEIKIKYIGDKILKSASFPFSGRSLVFFLCIWYKCQESQHSPVQILSVHKVLGNSSRTNGVKIHTVKAVLQDLTSVNLAKLV